MVVYIAYHELHPGQLVNDVPQIVLDDGPRDLIFGL